jgi:hypothetical protein
MCRYEGVKLMAHDDQRPFLQAWAEEIMSDSRYTDKKMDKNV